MRILQICKKFPYPLKDGEAVAVHQLAKGLKQAGAEVSLLAMNTTKHLFDWRTMPLDYDAHHCVWETKVDNRTKWYELVSHLFKSQPYHVTRLISNEFENQLKSILQQQRFDIIQLETPFLLHYLPIIKTFSKAKIAIRAHNVEHEVWQRLAENVTFMPKRLYLQQMARKLKFFETNALQYADLLVAISARDLARFRELGYTGEAVVCPVGMETTKQNECHKNVNLDKSIGFIGSLDWLPNLEGLLWFIEKVWQPFSSEWRGWSLHVAGRNTPKFLFEKQTKNLIFHGEVVDSTCFIQTKNIIIVPLFAGSGLRVKILESMANAKPVVSTSIGLEGIAAQHQKQVLVANTAQDFKIMLEKLMSQNNLQHTLGQESSAFVRKNFDTHAIGQELYESYQRLLSPIPKTSHKVGLEMWHS